MVVYLLFVPVLIMDSSRTNSAGEVCQFINLCNGFNSYHSSGNEHSHVDVYLYSSILLRNVQLVHSNNVSCNRVILSTNKGVK
jgi:hypothetical protein